MSTYPPHYAYPSTPPLQRALPSPPRLHWAWVLVLTIVTFGVFASIWLLVQSIWVKRMRGKSAGMIWAIINLVSLPLIFITAFVVGVVVALRDPSGVQAATSMVGGAARIVGLVLYLGTVFTLRSEMEAEPIGIPLGGGMTFFFGVFYFQYHLRDYGTPYEGISGALGLGAQVPAPTYPMSVPVESHYLPDAVQTTSQTPGALPPQDS